VIADLRRSRVDLVQQAIDGGYIEIEWILRELDRRFLIQPLYRASDGLIVARLAAR
jgi:hypothetical protein